MTKDSMLGDMSTRTKTTMVLPNTLVQHMGEVCYALGIPRNAWISTLRTVTPAGTDGPRDLRRAI